MANQEVNRVHVRVMGQEFVFLSPATRDHVSRLATVVDAKMRELQRRNRRLTPTPLAVMAALIFANQAEENAVRVSEGDELLKELCIENDELRAEIARLRNQLREKEGDTSDPRV